MTCDGFHLQDLHTEFETALRKCTGDGIVSIEARESDLHPSVKCVYSFLRGLEISFKH